MMNEMTQCDCCDYFTIEDGADYEICPICFWEQDSFGISEPDAESGANHGLTLHEGRSNFLRYGACAPRFVDKVISVAERAGYICEARAI